MLDYSQLNEAQREAVTTTEGYVRVIAAAGSGKTRALSMRFAYLVEELGVLPSNILCVTFTNKAANEMRQRIHHLVGDDDTALVNTFHGFCVGVLQEDSSAVAYPKSFLVLDNSDIDAMLNIVYEERGLTLRDMTFSKARDMIEIQKLFRKPQYFHDLIDLSLEAILEKYEAARTVDDVIFYGYLYQQKKCFALDYNDLLIFTLYIFETNACVREKWQRRLEYIMIDEFQDIDSIQYRLMEALCAHHGNLFVVGDPDQTIYTWRGANVRYLLDFDKRFENTKTIMMNENYRSTPQVVAVCNSLIEHNYDRIDKSIEATRRNGLKPVCHHAQNAADEANWIADQVECLLAEGAAARDICVLYRAHYVTRNVEEAFAARDIPYQIFSGAHFFDRREVKDALSYLRMVALHDDLSFARVVNSPKRNIGESRMRFLTEQAAQLNCTLYDALCANLDDPIFDGTQAESFVQLVEEHSMMSSQIRVSELLASLLEKSGYERALRTEGSQERLDNLAELRQSIHEYETACGEEATLEHYLAHVAFFSNLDVDLGKRKVRLMTVHAAKGLEFKHVFLCSMNEGIFPSRKVKTRAGMEEERRIAFVAMTRAQDTLYLSFADGSNLDGSPRYPSRFVLEVEEKLLSFTSPLAEGLVKEASSHIAREASKLRDEEEKPAFEVGSRISHASFGAGTIVDIDADRAAYVIEFDALSTERRIAFRARIELLDCESPSQ